MPEILPEALLLSALVFGPFAFGATEPWSVAVLEAAFAVLAFLVARRGQAQRTGAIRRTLFPAALFIAALAFAQYLHPAAVSAPAGILPFTVDRAATGRALILWASYAALLFAAPAILAAPGAVRRLLWAIFLSGVAVAVIGLMQKGQGNTAYYGLREVRRGAPFGPYANYDHAASMLVLALYAGGGIWFSRLGEIRGARSTSRLADLWAIQALLGFLLGVIAFALVCIRSRGAIHALAASAFALALASQAHLRGRIARLAITGAACACVAAFAIFVALHPVWIGAGRTDSSAAFRLGLYANGLEIGRDFPLFGTGLGSFGAVFQSYGRAGGYEGVVQHAHNDWLELLAQCGLTGFLSYCAGLAAAFAIGFRGWLGNASFEMRCLGGACLAAVLSFALHGLVDFSFQTPANAALFLALTVAAVAANLPSNEIPDAI